MSVGAQISGFPLVLPRKSEISSDLIALRITVVQTVPVMGSCSFQKFGAEMEIVLPRDLD